MFESLHSEGERGQVGIGTLIVFIAMVLVAAIAAGVLINTAGSLQSQASDTGTETQQAVANQIEVVHAYGENGGSQVDDLYLIVKKSAGSDVIDLQSMTMQYTSTSTSETLTLGDHETVDGKDHYNADSSVNEFGSVPLTGDDGGSLTDTKDRIELHIDVNNLDRPLQGGDSATIELVDQSGAQFSYGVTVPATFDGTVVEV